jgi:hypothetical protein
MTEPEVTREEAEEAATGSTAAVDRALARTVVALYDQRDHAVEAGKRLGQQTLVMRSCIDRLRASWDPWKDPQHGWCWHQRGIGVEPMTPEEQAVMAHG